MHDRKNAERRNEAESRDDRIGGSRKFRFAMAGVIATAAIFAIVAATILAAAPEPAHACLLPGIPC